jgi:hypothetical protein
MNITGFYGESKPLICWRNPKISDIQFFADYQALSLLLALFSGLMNIQAVSKSKLYQVTMRYKA